ncbi:hypothetical protein [Pseudodesulfovibrio sediminis]|uniref:Undecaprenyl-diphosphooligosaccharide--protein glycotransferase n=1 Tax=Pseudodesulfovibrio sediminis TaxID=2810563 RepID=A0ABN6ET17_9BACT|nr:hypothetical protein [Pseudodesulfovibrio sediminis]BCS89483.1 undecaprenyl-diphosphooligosaccharide--protein glycotransferase [Pseudodesulfovibrio sediminis]
MVTVRLGLTPWLVAVCLCAVTLSGLLAMDHTHFFADRDLCWSGVPVVGNNDGYFYLDQARTLAREGKTLMDVLSDSRPSMLLAYLLASVAGTDTDTLHLLGAYLGPVFGLSMLLGVLPWAMETRSRFVVLVSPLLALLAPYWLSRTHVGFLDTDSLVPGLCFCALYALYRFSIGRKHRAGWGGLYVVLLFFLWEWWRPGGYLVAGFVLLYLLYPVHSRFDHVLKLLLLGGLLCVVGLAVGGVKPWSGYGAYALAHLKLVFGGTEYSLVSSAITELGRIGLVELGDKSLGSVWLFILAALGTMVYGCRARWQAMFIVSTWSFGVASLFSLRFIPLFVPVAALFSVYGVVVTIQWLGALCDRFMRVDPRASAVLLALSLPVLFVGAGSNAARFEPESYFSRDDFALADTVRETFSQDTLIWTWWDYGYFFKYLTGMDTFFDGGSQTDATCFIAAYPLVQADMGAAARWMHHFADTSSRAFDTSRRGEQWAGYIKQFSAALESEETPFPCPVALVLPARVNTTVGYLYAFAHVFDEHPPQVLNRLDLFPKTGFRYLPEENSVVVPEAMIDKGYASFGSVVDATGKTPGDIDFTSLPDPYLVFSDGTDFLAVTDQTMVTSVYFRLLGLFEGAPGTIEPIRVSPFSGSLWRVSVPSD